MTTGPAVLNTFCIPSMTSRPSAAKSGPRWSIVGASMARSTRSGTLVGPGICRKWRPGRYIKRFHTVASGQESEMALRDLAATLRRELAGEVRADAYTRHLFAGDASVFAIEPLAVAFPRDADDVAAAVAI